MNLYLRLLIVVAAGLRASRLSINHHTRSRFRVWPHDLDAFGHMNNGRYLQIMDVARTDWMVRTGVVQAIWRNNWSALLGGGMTHYRHPLRLFQRYEVCTKLVHWDNRWFFFEHSFLDKRQRLIAVGVSRAAVRSHNTWVATSQAVDEICPTAERPVAPEYLGRWLTTECSLAQTAQSYVKQKVDRAQTESNSRVAS